MDDEYIKKETAIELLQSPVTMSMCLSQDECLSKRGQRAIDLELIKSIPAADVRPVVHGHKVTHNRPIAGYWASGKLDGGWDGMEGRVWVEPIMDNPVDYCSECGKRLDDTFQNFCPNCGARLDLGEDEG